MEEKEQTKEKAARGKRMAKSAAREICYTAMFVAIITVCAWISIPIGEIPITLQTMGVCLAAALLGWKRGAIATAVYILLGLCGVPVFTGFTGGVAKLVLPTGGYIVGFLFTALIVGAASDYIKIKNVLARMAVLAAAMAVGIAVCYAFGTAWFMALYARAEKSITLAGALSLCVVPYLLPDLVKVIFAAALVAKLKKYMKI
mgnify:FL=1|jgi:conserved hypothetical protein